MSASQYHVAFGHLIKFRSERRKWMLNLKLSQHTLNVCNSARSITKSMVVLSVQIYSLCPDEHKRLVKNKKKLCTCDEIPRKMVHIQIEFVFSSILWVQMILIVHANLNYNTCSVK